MERAEEPASRQEPRVDERPGEAASAPAGDEAGVADGVDVGADAVLAVERRRVAFEREEELLALVAGEPARFDGERSGADAS